MSSGDIDPAIPTSCNLTPLSASGAPSRTVGITCSTRASGAAAATGASASPRHAAAARAIPARMLGGLSTATAAGADRGRARNPTPNALTKVATPRPAVSATTPTANGMLTATTTVGGPVPVRLWISPWSSSHSETNPLPGGRAAAASAPNATNAVVTGIRAASPPRRSRSRSPVARSTDPAPKNSSVLKAAWLTACSTAAAISSPANARFPSAANTPAAPTPISISPTFSVVE